MQLPTATQLLATCQAEEKAGTASSKAPDCIAYYAIKQSCNVAALGTAVNPLVATVNPVAGSILTTAATSRSRPARRKASSANRGPMRLSKTQLFRLGLRADQAGRRDGGAGHGPALEPHLRITGPISHVGMVGAAPVPIPERIEVIQALTKVEQVSLADSIASARYAYILHALT